MKNIDYQKMKVCIFYHIGVLFLITDIFVFVVRSTLILTT